MANLQATLRARLPLEDDLEKLASELDYEIHAQTTPESYLTLFMGVLDPVTRVLTWVNACGQNFRLWFLQAIGVVPSPQP